MTDAVHREQTGAPTPDAAVDPEVREMTAPILGALSGNEPSAAAGGRAFQAGHGREGVIREAIETLEVRLDLMKREHSGMADEVLRAYEQLGLVFDLTRNLLALSSERQAVQMFVDRLRAAYSDVRIVIVDADRRAYDRDGEKCTLADWILESLDEAQRERRVTVARANKHDAHIAASVVTGRRSTLSEQALIAPIFADPMPAGGLGASEAGAGSGASLTRAAAGDAPPQPCGFAWAVVLWRVARRCHTETWESGDMLLLDSLAVFCGDVIRNFRLVQRLQDMSMEMVRTLVSAVDQKDPYTSGHSNRVGYYARLLAREIGFDDSQLRTLEWSALLHDVGKIGIRDDVLKKEGKLTDDEFTHIKEHPLRGFEVVREMPHMREAMDGVLHHHERFDGTGYPAGLRGEEIPLQARIIQIADIFDALTTTRSYRSAFAWTKALSIMEQEAGTVTDPQLANSFITMMRRLHEQNPAAFDAIGRTDVELDLAADGGARQRRGPAAATTAGP